MYIIIINVFWKEQQANFLRKRKKKPTVNKYSRTIINISAEKVTSSKGENRLFSDQTNLNTNSEVISKKDDYFLLINFSILSLFALLLVCPECGYKKITISDNRKSRKGLAHNLEISCESFYSILWTRCPKNIFVSRRTFEICINSAIIHYNDGGDGIKSILSSFL